MWTAFKQQKTPKLQLYHQTLTYQISDLGRKSYKFIKCISDLDLGRCRTQGQSHKANQSQINVTLTPGGAKIKIA